VDSDAARRKLVQQGRYRGRYLAVTRYHHRPFEVLPELSRADAPLIEKWRCCRSDLNERPVPDEGECRLVVRQGTAHDEMIVAMHQKADFTSHAYICNTLVVMRRLFLIAGLSGLFAVGLPAQDRDPDRALKGGGLPEGWNVRPDRGTADQIRLAITGDVYHFAMAPAGTFYRSDWTKSGNYQFSARLTQMKAPTHPISYGLMIGGSELAGPNQTYSYFLVRNQGEYFVANREGDKRPITVVSWTANPAIVKEGSDGRQTNTLGIRVQGDDVIFTVNGTEVTKLAKSKLHTDGMYGFRIGHNLDVDVDQVKR
jgi:hypothetical protein